MKIYAQYFALSLVLSSPVLAQQPAADVPKCPPGASAKPNADGSVAKCATPGTTTTGTVAVTKSETSATKNYDCFAYEAAPAGGDYFFGSGGQWFYFLAPQPADAKQKDDMQKHTLYRLDLLTGKTQAIFAARVKPSAGLIPIGLGQVRGATILNFRGGVTGCYTGAATGVSVALTSSTGGGKAVKSFALGDYRLVAGDEGARVADTKLGAIKDVDTDTFQQRTTMHYLKTTIPIYASSKRNRSIMLEPGAQNYLRSYSGGRAKPDNELLIPSGWRILQQGNLIGLTNWNAATGQLTIREIPGWTDLPKEEVYKTDVDPKLDVNKGNMVVNYKSQVVALYGGRLNARESWKKMYVYHYKTNRLIGSLDLTEDQYVSGAAIDTDGEQVIVLLRNKKTNAFIATKGFNFVKKVWVDYPL